MCGIAGIYSLNHPSKELIQGVTNSLAHRGPDAYGYFFTIVLPSVTGDSVLSIWIREQTSHFILEMVDTQLFSMVRYTNYQAIATELTSAGVLLRTTFGY